MALEDTTSTTGALKIVPGSHKWDLYHYHDLNLPHPDQIQNGEEVNYREYEDFIRCLVEAKNTPTETVELKAGQALIWASNLLHGGSKIIDKDRTRFSQAIHYFFNGCSKYYHPMFSIPFDGVYAEKWCNEQHNIKTP